MTIQNIYNVSLNNVKEKMKLIQLIFAIVNDVIKQHSVNQISSTSFVVTSYLTFDEMAEFCKTSNILLFFYCDLSIGSGFLDGCCEQ